MYWIADLKTGKSHIKALASGKGLLTASSHGGCQKRKHEGRTCHSVMAPISPMRVKPSGLNYFLNVPLLNIVKLAITFQF